jgi:diguanylate cyclase (GGDEF)-like protein/PAS domain S-box-containing protein
MASIVAITLSAMVLSAVLSAVGVRAALLEERKELSRHLVMAGLGILDHFYWHYQNGHSTETEARHSALEALRNLRFEELDEENEYFWVTDLHPRMLMHATQPELEGRDLTDYTDLNEKRLFIEFRDLVLRDGAGYVDYWWPRPGLEEPIPKVSHVMLFAPWGWVIGSGVYLDDVDRAFWRQVRSQAGIITGFLLLLGTLIVLIVRRIEQRIERYAADLQHTNADLQHFTNVAEEAQELAHLGNWEWSLGDDMLEWSEEIYRIFGLTPDTFEATHEAFLERLHPDDRPKMVQAIHEAFTAKKPFELNCRVLLPDQTTRYVYIRAQPDSNEGGEIVRLFGTLQDITELKESEAALDRLAHHDPLTGLPNRLLLTARAQHALDQAGRKGHQVAILFLDLDRFKYINDTLGHPAGDLLLQQVAERLLECVRKGDTVSRLGGDEFTLVLEDLENASYASLVAGKILAALSRKFSLHGHDVFVTGSIGITLFPVDGEDVMNLFKNADSALYRAKEQGRDNYQYYTEALTRAAEERLQLEHELRHALEHDELRLHYQPQVDSRQGTITGMEALVRWQHPQRGLLSPASFISLAEETGLIVPLGEWVLRTACAQNKAWIDAGVSTVPVAVNLSPNQFRQKDLDKMIAGVLEETGLPPAYLELEITESLAMFDVEASIQLLRRLKDIGVSFSIDDFGTGYSSLSYLKRFPIDKIKIDQSFVRNITTDPDDAAISQAIISLAHSLKLKVIAEGVELAEQREFLGTRLCDELQGYLFSRPVPGEAMTNILREQDGGHGWAMHEAAKAEPTLLLVDDQRTVLNALSRLLRIDGYRILVAESTHAAFDVLATNRVDVIVSDNRMPEMEGVELLRRVRALYPDTVRILLTGYPDWPTAEAAVNEGSVYKIIAKPWDDFRLREIIRGAFSISHRTEAPTG